MPPSTHRQVHILGFWNYAGVRHWLDPKTLKSSGWTKQKTSKQKNPNQNKTLGEEFGSPGVRGHCTPAGAPTLSSQPHAAAEGPHSLQSAALLSPTPPALWPNMASSCPCYPQAQLSRIPGRPHPRHSSPVKNTISFGPPLPLTSSSTHVLGTT